MTESHSIESKVLLSYTIKSDCSVQLLLTNERLHLKYNLLIDEVSVELSVYDTGVRTYVKPESCYIPRVI
jgi:hypothetical protein